MVNAMSETPLFRGAVGKVLGEPAPDGLKKFCADPDYAVRIKADFIERINAKSLTVPENNDRNLQQDGPAAGPQAGF